MIAGTKSIGMSLDTCTVPGSPKEGRIPPGRAELGLGIHGEAGVEQVDYAGAQSSITRSWPSCRPRWDRCRMWCC